MKTVVTSTVSSDSHTSSFENLMAFIDEKIEAEGSWELAKISQVLRAEAGAGATVLDSKFCPSVGFKSSPLYSTPRCTVSSGAPEDKASSDTFYRWVLTSLSQYPHRQTELRIHDSH